MLYILVCIIGSVCCCIEVYQVTFIGQFVDIFSHNPEIGKPKNWDMKSMTPFLEVAKAKFKEKAMWYFILKLTTISLAKCE